MTDAVSHCCAAPLDVGGEGSTHWWICTSCDLPCDGVPAVVATAKPSPNPSQIRSSLSAAAEAVMDAVAPHPAYGPAIAAALRAAALHLDCEEVVTCGGSAYALVIEQDDLLALAAELEGSDA